MTSLFAKSRKGTEEGEKIKGKFPEGQLLEAMKRHDLQVALRLRVAGPGVDFSREGMLLRLLCLERLSPYPLITWLTPKTQNPECIS